ncbi:MAG: phosphoribosyltransferase domain-containing protein [Puniceicoccales bacterium]|jgi:xanthine phosphoribosyltransferase|nr:phosphoribosyltransferase domain-containing protein [Puniceicoccales bacterium]
MPPPDHSFDALLRRLRNLQFAEHFDMVVAIANGGLIPAALLREHLDIEMNVLRVNWRDTDNTPKGPQPVLLREPDFAFAGKKIILADDRIKTGVTVAFAKKLLSAAALIRTFAINGDADYAIWNESCFPMPWRTGE